MAVKVSVEQQVPQIALRYLTNGSTWRVDMRICSLWEHTQKHHNSSAPQCHTFPSDLYAK